MRIPDGVLPYRLPVRGCRDRRGRGGFPGSRRTQRHPRSGRGRGPGIVLLIGGAGVLVAGIALIVLVMRMLLAQAVARDAEAHHLEAELDEVI